MRTIIKHTKSIEEYKEKKKTLEEKTLLHILETNKSIDDVKCVYFNHQNRICIEFQNGECKEL